MKILALLTLILATTSYATITPGDISLGISVGNPSGVTSKVWVDQKSAFNFSYAYSPNQFYLIADYLYHLDTQPLSVKPYVGLGAELAFWDQSAFGFRVPVGLEYLPFYFKGLGFYWELDPGMFVAPCAHGFLQGSTGVRFYL